MQGQIAQACAASGREVSSVRFRLAAWRPSRFAVSQPQEIKMPLRLRKFIGMLMLLALVVIYAMAASTFAVARLAESHWLTHLAFFAFSGILWVLPAMGIIKWMAGPRASHE
jgi:hypothetical protein